MHSITSPLMGTEPSGADDKGAADFQLGLHREAEEIISG